MGRIHLKYKGITEIVGSDKLGLIVLTDEQEEMQLSIVCDTHMEAQFALRSGDAPIVKKLLPEVLWQIINKQTALHLEILIKGINNGQYDVTIHNADNNMEVPVRASDGILLSSVSDIPIYIDETLMLRQAVPFRKGARGMSLPINTISDGMLQSAMQKAIAEENYELASQLRDEEKRRKNLGLGKRTEEQ